MLPHEFQCHHNVPNAVRPASRARQLRQFVQRQEAERAEAVVHSDHHDLLLQREDRPIDSAGRGRARPALGQAAPMQLHHDGHCRFSARACRPVDVEVQAVFVPEYRLNRTYITFGLHAPTGCGTA
jgi:hypothetical protein